MRKLKYLFLISTLIVFVIGCNKSQDPGLTGPAGPTGVQGGGFSGPISVPFELTDNSIVNGTNPNKYAVYTFLSNPNSTYMLSVYVSKIATGSPPYWAKLPWYNVYVTGDELNASIGLDTIKIWYTGGIWPTDSSMDARIIIIPQQSN